MSSPIPPVLVTYESVGDDRVVTSAKRIQQQLDMTGRQTTALGRSAGEAGRGFKKFENALTNLGFQMVGVNGTTAKLAEGLSLMSLGGPVTLGIVAGLAAIGVAYELLTKKSREARESTEKLTSKLTAAARARADADDPAGAVRRALLGGDKAKGEEEGEGLQKRIDRISKDLANAQRGKDVFDRVTGGIKTIVDEKKVKDLQVELAKAAGAAAEVGRQYLDAVEANSRRLVAARLDATRDGIQQELAAKQQGTKADERLNQEEFARGLKSLSAYYDRRRAIALAATADEVAALLKERNLVARRPLTGKTQSERDADAIKREAERVAIESRIATVQRTGKQTTLDLIEQQRVAEKALAEERLKSEQQILEAQGKAFVVALANIEEQARQRRERLRHQGVTGDDQDAEVERLRRVLVLQAQATEAERQAQTELASLDRERQRIQDQVLTGQLSEQQGQEAIAALEVSRLPALRAIAEQMQAFAAELQNPALIQQAQELTAQLDHVAAGANLAAQRSAQFNASVVQVTESGLTDFLASAGTEAESFGQAFLGMVGQVAAGIRRIVSELFAARIVHGIKGLLASAGGAAFGGGAFGVDGGSSDVLFAATGGPVPGSGRGDTVPAMLEPGEFVVNRRATARHFGLLAEINEGIYPVRPVSYGRQYFNTGGLVTDSSSSASIDGELRVSHDPGLILQVVRSNFPVLIQDFRKTIRGVAA